MSMSTCGCGLDVTCCMSVVLLLSSIFFLFLLSSFLLPHPLLLKVAYSLIPLMYIYPWPWSEPMGQYLWKLEYVFNPWFPIQIIFLENCTNHVGKYIQTFIHTYIHTYFWGGIQGSLCSILIVGVIVIMKKGHESELWFFLQWYDNPLWFATSRFLTIYFWEKSSLLVNLNADRGPKELLKLPRKSENI